MVKRQYLIFYFKEPISHVASQILNKIEHNLHKTSKYVYYNTQVIPVCQLITNRGVAVGGGSPALEVNVGRFLRAHQARRQGRRRLRPEQAQPARHHHAT